MSTTITNNIETTETTIISSPQTAEQKDAEYNIIETQPKSGEVSPDEESEQYEQEEESDEEPNLNSLKFQKKFTAEVEKVVVKFMNRNAILKKLEKIKQMQANINEMSESEKLGKIKQIADVSKLIETYAIEESEYKEAKANIRELCETYPNLNTKVMSLEEYIYILKKLGERMPGNSAAEAGEEFNESFLEQYVIVNDRIANTWRPYILSTTFFAISIILPLICYAMYIILYTQEIFTFNPYINEIFYEGIIHSFIAACLLQFSTFNWQILKRTIFIREFNFYLFLATMNINRSLILYDQNDLNTIDYISAFLRLVALFLLIYGTSCFHAWHVDKTRKVIILIGVIFILIYQFIKIINYPISTADKLFDLSFYNILEHPYFFIRCMIRTNAQMAPIALVCVFLKQLWYLIRRWNSNEAIAVITHSVMVWVKDEYLDDDIDRMSSYENGFSGTLIIGDECVFFIPKFLVP